MISSVVAALLYKVMLQTSTYDWTINLQEGNPCVIRLRAGAMERSLNEFSLNFIHARSIIFLCSMCPLTF